MKEPWQVFFDEFWREINRRSSSSDDGQARVMTAEEATKALHSSEEATVYHLVEIERLTTEDALALIRRFQDSLTAGPADEWKSRMRDIWTDWRLSHRR